MSDKQPDEGQPLGGVTKRVTVGGFVLKIGFPAGTQISLAPPGQLNVPESLAQAIDADAKPRKHDSAVVHDVEEAVGNASEVTGKVERALELFKALTEGKILDSKALTGEVDDLLELLGKLDRAGRWKDALRLARSLSSLLALLMRWSDLIRSLRTVLRAAHEGDSDSAWALHELGTLHLAGGDTRGADQLLDSAHRAREQLGDRPGLAATERNLRVLCHVLREDLRQAVKDPHPLQRWLRTPIGALIAAAILFGAGGVAGAMIGGSPSPEPTVLGTSDGSPGHHTTSTSPSGGGGSTSTTARSSTEPAETTGSTEETISPAETTSTAR